MLLNDHMTTLNVHDCVYRSKFFVFPFLARFRQLDNEGVDFIVVWKCVRPNVAQVHPWHRTAISQMGPVLTHPLQGGRRVRVCGAFLQLFRNNAIESIPATGPGSQGLLR